MLAFDSKTPENPNRPRETLFTIDDRECSVPVTFEPLEMARYAHMIEQFGADQAGVWALRYALGDDNYFAFLNLPPEAVTKEDFVKVMGLVTGRLVGLDLMIPEGKAQVGEASGASPTSPDTTPAPAAGDQNVEPPDSEVWPDEEPLPGPTYPAPAD